MRHELAEQVWGPDTFVDFEQGLNFAIRQIRSALEDHAEHPRYLETLPKRGYRFIASVSGAAIASPTKESAPALMVESRGKNSRHWTRWTAAAVVVLTGLFVGWRYLRQNPPDERAHPGIHSLAVLPLHNLSNDPQQEYFSEGMTEELITDLAKISQLKVISHTSVQRYTGTTKPLPEIARELGVDAVVEGSVMRSGDHVRITAQLIDARSDRHIWAENYERDFQDVLALQDEVAQRIASEIGVSLTESEQLRMAGNLKVDPAAHEAYLKGNLNWGRLSCDGFENAIKFYQEALEKDPNFAPAYVNMADSYFKLADWRCSPQDAFAKADAAAQKAIVLDPNSAEAHAVLGKLAFYHEWNWAKADEEFSKALALDPSAANIHIAYGVYLISVGRQAQALAMMRTAHELDPVSEYSNMLYVYVLYLARDYDQAIIQAKKTLDLYPDSTSTAYWLGQSYEKKGRFDDAMASYLKATAGLPDQAALVRSAYKKEGVKGFWRENLEWRQRNGWPVDPVIEAIASAHLGDKDKTLERLNAAFQQHCDGLQFLRVEPAYDGVRDDPRFKKLMGQVHL